MSFNWPKFLDDHGIHYNTEGKDLGSGYIGLDVCPFCNKGPNKIGLSIEWGNVNCWYCQKHTKLDTIQALLSCTKDKALSLYGKYKTGGGYTPVAAMLPPKGVVSVDLPAGNFTKAEQIYMDKRGITDYHIKKYDIRSGGILHPMFAYRIIFPVVHKGEIVSAHARTIAKEVEPRYKALPAYLEVIPHKHCLFGGQFANGDTICLVEGDIDCVLGGDGFVSCFGTTTTAEQVELLSKYKRVFVAFDNDAPGIAAGSKIANILSVLGTEVVAISWDACYKDIGSMPATEVAHLRRELGL